MEIRSETVSKLLLQIEKVRRRKIADYNTEDAIEYIDASNNLEKILVANNHLVFGRRGSGKTTLILAALKKSVNSIVVPIDIQPIKDEETDNIIIKILVQALNKLQQGFILKFSEQEALYKKQYKGLRGVISFFSRRRDKEVYDEQIKGGEFQKLIIKAIALLENLKDLPQEVTYTISEANSRKDKDNQKVTSTRESTIKIGGNLGIESSYKIFNLKIDAAATTVRSYSLVKSSEFSSEYTAETKTSYEKTLKKNDLLKEQKELIAFLFNELKMMYGISIAVYLDDFYQIQIENQPDIIQFLHDIYKYCNNSSFCFKISALPYRLRTNKSGNVDMSYKDDFSPIKLDSDLSELNTTKEYLLSILVNLDISLLITKQDITSLFNNDEVLIYSIIATGGVPRDFLLMFANLVETARNDNRDTIQKEHIYTVVKSLREDKDNNIEYDSIFLLI